MLKLLTRDGIGIGIDDEFPYRKKPCLVIRDRNVETKYAVFTDEETAEKFFEKLCEFCVAIQEVSE